MDSFEYGPGQIPIYVGVQNEDRYSGFWRQSARQAPDALDIDQACGYPLKIGFTDYLELYRRMGLARRVVDIYPNECWKIPPIISENMESSETEFEKQWKTVCTTSFDLSDVGDEPPSEVSTSLLYYIKKTDRLAGIGKYGCLLFGLDDGLPLDKPVVQGSASRILWMKAMREDQIKIADWNTDNLSSRNGLPEIYQMGEKRIHWSRVFHFSEDNEDSEVYGTPRMQPVYNNLLDLKKILGGSGEMFWKGAWPGFAFVLDPEVNLLDERKTDMKDEIQKYFLKMQRYLTLQGVKVETLNANMMPPTAYVEAQIQHISATTGIPFRILVGSEQAKLASTQDRLNFNGNVRARQEDYCAERILKPMISRLVWYGVLPRPEKVQIDWPDTFSLSEIDQADISRKKTESLVKYADSPNSQAIIPHWNFLVSVLGFTRDEADEIIRNIEQDFTEELSDEDLFDIGTEDGL